MTILHTEEFKAFLACVLCGFTFFFSFVSIALVHDKMPDRKIYKPVPDIFLDRVKSYDFLWSVAEVQLIMIQSVCLILLIFHKFR